VASPRIPILGSEGNNYFCWFHVFEDEINHRGQIRLLAKQLPRFKNRGVLGVQFAPTRDNGMGLKFAEVAHDGPAAKAGIQAGDIVIELNGVAIREAPLEEIDVRGQARETVFLKVRRADELLNFEIVREPVKTS
jgi:C-terminal processing protease CtpA/Prc